MVFGTFSDAITSAATLALPIRAFFLHGMAAAKGLSNFLLAL